MEVKDFLDIDELEGQLVKGTWCGYTFTTENGKVYKIEEGIRGWCSGLFYINHGKPEDIPEWNVSNLFERHFVDLLDDVLKELGTVNANEDGAISNTIFRHVKRRWYKKWLNNNNQ